MVYMLANYTFFITDGGYMGMAFKGCHEGDAVVLLAGAHFPVVLRARGSEYRFLAPAYIHGIMQGEAWPDDDSKLQTIVLM